METKKKKGMSELSSLDIFINIKKVESNEGKEYYKISPERNKLELYDYSKNISNPDCIALNPTYVFEEKNLAENCVMYENVCRNAVNELLVQGKRQCYITYGLEKTGKKRTIFGGENSNSNKNSRGLLYRLVEELMDKINSSDTISESVSLYYNFYCVNQNKLLEFSKIKDFESIQESEVIKMFEVIQPERNYELEANRKQIISIDDFISNVSKPLTMLYRLEPCGSKLFSKSTLILNVQVHRIVEGTPKINNASFVCLASNETSKSYPQEFNLKKIKHTINTNADIANLIQIFKDLNRPEETLSKRFNVQSHLISAMKANFTNSTSFKIVGCIFPASCYYEKVKDTIMIMKRLSQKQGDRDDFEPENEEESKETIIYNLSKKLNDSEKEIDKKRNEIQQLLEEIRSKEERYTSNLQIIKIAFGFEGDISKLLLNDNDIKESRYARKIKESTTSNVILQNKIKELQGVIENLKKEKDKIMVEKTVLENDMAMVTMYSKIKENNISEEKKLKDLLEYNREKEGFKKQNDNLLLQVEALKKEIELRNQQYKQLPSILKDNISSKSKLGEIKEDLKSKYESSIKDEVISLKDQHRKEMNLERAKFEKRIRELEDKIVTLETKNNGIDYNHDKKMSKVFEEMNSLNTIINKILKVYKQRLDMRKVNLTNLPPGYFIKLKDALDNDVNEIMMKINKFTFPFLFEAMNKFGQFEPKDTKTLSSQRELDSTNSNQPLSDIKAAELKDSKTKLDHILIKSQSSNSNNIAISNKMSVSEFNDEDLDFEMASVVSLKYITKEELEGYEKRSLVDLILSLQLKFENFTNLYKQLKKDHKQSKKEVKIDENTNTNFQRMHNEIENLKQKLKEQVNLTNKYKIILQSQERSLINYKNEQFYKLEKDKLDVRVQSASLFNKSKQGADTSKNIDTVNSELNNLSHNVISTSTRVNTAKTANPLGRITSAVNRPHTGISRPYSNTKDKSSFFS